MVYFKISHPWVLVIHGQLMCCLYWTYLGPEPAPFFADSNLLKYALIALPEALLTVVRGSAVGREWCLVSLVLLVGVGVVLDVDMVAVEVHEGV